MERPPVHPDARPARGPLTRVLDGLGSISFGVFLLFLLFVYSSIGSAGLPIGEGVLTYPFLLRPEAWISVRELWELSEFEWFHWWPFDVLIVLICLTLVTATLRRIPFNAVNLGVWMIHGGIIVLAIGSVWYFGTKVEGDAPVARRRVVATVPGHDPVSSITPDWELLSGDDAGRRTYKVSVVARHAGDVFVRELLAGYPQYTEDLVRAGDPEQPFARAKKTLGRPLVDETLELRLEYAPQDRFYVRESAAIYLREQGTRDWIERPVRRLPRFKDHLTAHDDVWTATGAERSPLRPLDLAVPAVDTRDPLPDVTFRIGDYLRYASMQTRRLPGGDRLDPAISIELSDDRGRTERFDMRALDPQGNTLGGGVIRFDWAGTPAELETLRATASAGLRIVGGPGEDEIHVLIPAEGGGLEERALRIGESVELRPGTFFTITDFVARSRVVTRPLVVPPRQRNRDLGVQASMVRLHVPVNGGVASEWLTYHHYPFAAPEEVFLRFPYEPSVVHLGDGRHVEIIFSRAGRRLPTPVVLDDFRLTTHVGGYAGSTASIRDWTSVVRFAEPGGGWSEEETVSVNAPKERGGYWFFQSQWDPPIAPNRPGDLRSAGLNYTVLGVGNREGVVTQLVGCCIAVVGMIYAFYVKPVIKRRRRQAVYARPDPEEIA